MKWPLPCMVLLAAGASQLAASDLAAGQQALDSAHTPAGLFQQSATPFILEVDFRAQLDSPTEGRFLLKQQSRDQWWSKVVFGPFQQITIQNGEERYIARNLNFTPMAVTSLFQLLEFMENPLTLTAMKEKGRTEAGSAFRCVEAQRGEIKHDRREFCLDTATHDLLSESWGDSVESRKAEYANYVAFGGISYPKKLDLTFNGSRIISADVLKLQAAPFDSQLLIPPQGAIERRQCPGMKPPEVIQRTDLGIVPAGQGTHMARVSLTVLADGSVGDAELLTSGGRDLDGAVLAAVKKWRFKPAMCGVEPVVADIQADFRLTKD